jgi:hypothetical protein
MLSNLEAVVSNYVGAGVRYVVMALTIEHAWELARLREVAPEPLHVVRLEVPLETIRSRLSSDPTSGRQVDLEWATKALERGAGRGLEDYTVTNDQPVGEVVQQVLETVGWSLAGDG